MTRHLHLLSAVVLLALGAATGASAAAQPEAKSQCFASNTWKNWTASPDGDKLYLRVGLNDVYEVDLSPGSHVRKYPGSFLVNRVRGSSWICSALDLDLTLSDDVGMRQPVIARSMRRLTPAEVAAIPAKYRP